MAVINQYKATYPSKVNNFESDSFYINANSMQKAVEMASIQYGNEPTICTKIRDNVLTEITESTTVDFQIKSYYIDEDTQQEIEVPNCVAYPTTISSCTRGNTVYCYSPNEYSFIVDGNTEDFVFDKWVNGTEESTENPYVVTIPLDETISTMTVKAMWRKSN